MMTTLEALTRRLRRYISDSPYGISVSGLGASESLAGSTNNLFNISIGGSTPEEVNLGDASFLVNAHIITTKIQEVVRALHPDNILFSNFKAEYVDGKYVLRAGAPSSEGRVVVTNAATDNAADDLKLGIYNGGVEYIDPAPKYSDDDLEYFINDGLSSLNELADKNLAYDDLTSHEGLLVLHYGWLNALEALAGESVYTYRQTIGRDTTDFSQIFKNILELLKYLRGRIQELEDESGIGSIFVTELTRHNELRDEREPTYVASTIKRPVILNLAKVTSTSLLIEWDEIHHQDFEAVEIYTDTTVGNMVDLSLITAENSSNRNGIVETATKHRTLYNGFNTVYAVKDLPTTVINVIVLIRTRRQRYLYSDQYSIDLAAATPTATVEYRNA